MSRNNNGRHRLASGETLKTSDSGNRNGGDPLIGWFNLAKLSRSRQQKRSWQWGISR